MKTRFTFSWLLVVFAVLGAASSATAADPNPAPPSITEVTLTNGQKRLTWTPFPGAKQYQVLSGTDVAAPLSPDSTGVVSGYNWTASNSLPASFHRVQVTPLSSNELLSATVLNRLTYGPTPESVEEINQVGPQQFIDDQLKWDEIVEDLDNQPPIVNNPIVTPPPPPLTNWIRVTDTGVTSGRNFGIILSAPGSVYVDDVRLVYGTNADVGENLLPNGDFEDPVLTNGWSLGPHVDTSRTMITNSPTVDGNAASGSNCLFLVGQTTGANLSHGVWLAFTNANPSQNQKFTVSFAYLPVQQTASNISLIVGITDRDAAGVVALPNPPSIPPSPPTPPRPISPIYAKLTNCAPPMAGYERPPVNVTIADLRAYHVMHAVQSKRQLYEIMVQFFDNHFTTEYQKIKDWFDNNYGNSITNPVTRENLAVDLDWREHNKWRKALLDPNCTFLDLLKISFESPMMVIYLDTIQSTKAAPNENYAREILELHTMGVDNGYVQQDIVELARVWTGWSVAKKDASLANDPFAPAVTDPTNMPGLFTLHFKTNNHTTSLSKKLFTNVVVEPRFGPFRGGQPYAYTIGVNQYPGTNGMAEGYAVAQYLANLPQTMEFISIKLCRLFVHEGFVLGDYDYGAPDSPEAKLVKECMTAWDTPAPGDGRKGNIRLVLKAIFDSDLFRGHGASQQKIKTPLEFAVSAIRALRLRNQDTNDWISVTADTDGYALTGDDGPLDRMGGMNLFAKPEPDGWSEFGRNWMSTANLCERMRFAQHLCMLTASTLKDDDYGTTRNVSDPVKLLKLKLPAASWNNAGAVADYFLGILFPGEGQGNLDLDRTAAITFLNTAENGSASSFSALSNTTEAYEGRVRGMIGMLMSFPRFQEQ